MCSTELVKIVGHRGAPLVTPENTMASFRAGIDLGADGIEFDVQQSADGELVVIHDFTLDRTTTGSGLVATQRWSSLRMLDAGGWFSPTFAGEPIPRLAEILELSHVEFELELKGFGEPFLDAVLDEVHRAGVLGRVEFTSSNVPLLMRLKTSLPEARVGFFSSPQPKAMEGEAFEHYIVGVAETAPFDVAHVKAAHITSAIVTRLHDLGMQVHANDADIGTDVARALSAGADRLSTSDVAAAVAVRSGRQPVHCSDSSA